MREIIMNELTQAMHEIARGFARFLPRLLVMLVIILVGFVIAYILKAALRSILRLARFDRLAEHAGATELLKKFALPSSTELLSRFIFWVAWLGFILMGISVLEIVGIQEHIQVSLDSCRGCLPQYSCSFLDCWPQVSSPALHSSRRSMRICHPHDSSVRRFAC